MNIPVLDTPVVLVDLDIVEANIKRAQQKITSQGMAFRPHIKTHKIPAIGKMQIDAGAVGLTCQKLGEAEVFAESGVTDDILLTFNIVGESKAARLAALTRKLKRMTVVLDNEVVARGLSEAGVKHDVDMRFMVECDTGFGRNGVQSPQAALDLVKMVMSMPRMKFAGLMTFPLKAPDTANFLSAAIDLFAKAGIDLPSVSGGGTPAMLDIEKFPMLTEHRAGTYVYNDAMMVAAGAAEWKDCALTVRATVVSRPTPTRVILDAGSKILTYEQYYAKGYGRIVEYPDAQVVALSEEHGMVDLPAGSTKQPQIGEIVHIIPNHCCVVTNMVDSVVTTRKGQIEAVVPVAARGLVR